MALVAEAYRLSGGNVSQTALLIGCARSMFPAWTTAHPDLKAALEEVDRQLENENPVARFNLGGAILGSRLRDPASRDMAAQLVADAYRHAHGKVLPAARLLGCTRSAIYAWAKSYEELERALEQVDHDLLTQLTRETLDGKHA